MKKAYILLLYGTALYFILRKYYSEDNSGLPQPNVLVAPTYLYGILALSADFLSGLPIVLASGFTVALIWQAQTAPASAPLARKPSGVPPVNVAGPVGGKSSAAGNRTAAPNPATKSLGPNGPSGPVLKSNPKG